jgi:hypothetical protein
VVYAQVVTSGGLTFVHLTQPKKLVSAIVFLRSHRGAGKQEEQTDHWF